MSNFYDSCKWWLFDFLTSLFFSIYIFVYLCVLVWAHTNSYFMSWMFRYSYTFLWNCPKLSSESHFKLASLSFWYIPIILFSHSLLYVTTICPKLIFYFLCHSPGLSHFSKEPQLLLGIVYRNQYLRVRLAHCYRGSCISRPFQLEELQNIHISVSSYL